MEKINATYEKKVEKFGDTHWFRKILYPRKSKIQ
ncbi:hypothetical protein SAMN05421544_101163 [Riemerella columbipharyngis]|uniref:Uncharacterized protein n=1 Tax=Riemerella columbipharyngis TaxID=1071918 RepID=A0A1G6YI98_9FLAO|nr:hypothetical protein SAMN05421544_101163 [Riemerella columbipharyngis]